MERTAGRGLLTRFVLALAGACVLGLGLGAVASAQDGDTQAKIRTSIETMVQAIEEEKWGLIALSNASWGKSGQAA